jgi:hypothetical protein
MSFTDSIAVAARLHTLVEGGGSGWTAVCGLEGTVRRLSPEQGAAALHALGTLARALEGIDDDDKAAKAVVGCEALIQGICPVQAWADWSRLHGCAEVTAADLIKSADKNEDALVPRILEALSEKFGDDSDRCRFTLDWDDTGHKDVIIYTDYLWDGAFAGYIFYDGANVWVVDIVPHSKG